MCTRTRTWNSPQTLEHLDLRPSKHAEVTKTRPHRHVVCGDAPARRRQHVRPTVRGGLRRRRRELELYEGALIVVLHANVRFRDFRPPPRAGSEGGHSYQYNFENESLRRRLDGDLSLHLNRRPTSIYLLRDSISARTGVGSAHFFLHPFERIHRSSPKAHWTACRSPWCRPRSAPALCIDLSCFEPRRFCPTVMLSYNFERESLWMAICSSKDVLASTCCCRAASGKASPFSSATGYVR